MPTDRKLMEGCIVAMRNVTSEIPGSVWKVETREGAEVKENDVLIILESMKMEIPVLAPEDGTVREIRVKEGDAVSDGQVLVVLEV